jgi:methionyl-tRNA formyltransferase
MPLRIVFCGTPAFAVPSLRQLIAQPDFQIAGVITQPDRPRGRGGEISISPLKKLRSKRACPSISRSESRRKPLRNISGTLRRMWS